jgi:hypothetical protein
VLRFLKVVGYVMGSEKRSMLVGSALKVVREMPGELARSMSAA